MNLSELTKITTKDKKRVGRGHGSGRGKTSGRGTKGQLARHGKVLDFDGDANPLIRRLPFLRGKGRNKPLYTKPLTINLKDLEKFPSDSVIDIESLAKANLVSLADAALRGVKILGSGEITKSLTIKIPLSKNAALKIEKAGGKVSSDH